MKYIGNYKDWISDSWLPEILNNPGIPKPKSAVLPSAYHKELYETSRQAGYNMDGTHYWIYEKDHLTFDIVSPPWISGKYVWWFTKMYPGQYMPMHMDPHTLKGKCNRFWVPIQDYISGHIFISDDVFAKDYKAGDVFMFTNPTDVHGAANIGYEPRVVLQITEFL